MVLGSRFYVEVTRYSEKEVEVEVEVDVDVNDEISEQSIARPSRWLRDKSKRYDLV